ncbi:MAG TPA: hypothetical protein VES70_11560, partial [Pseudomonas sp.]|nr:hypothetical protein [Pseudomonas sp.]
MPTAPLSIEQKTQLLLNDPTALVNYSQHAWNHLPRAEIDALQLNGLKQRFDALRHRIPVLKKLADAQGVEQIEQLDDVVPLLF